MEYSVCRHFQLLAGWQNKHNFSRLILLYNLPEHYWVPVRPSAWPFLHSDHMLCFQILAGNYPQELEPVQCKCVCGPHRRLPALPHCKVSLTILLMHSLLIFGIIVCTVLSISNCGIDEFTFLFSIQIEPNSCIFSLCTLLHSCSCHLQECISTALFEIYDCILFLWS